MKKTTSVRNVLILGMLASMSFPAWSYVTGQNAYRVEMTMGEDSQTSLKSPVKTEVSDVELKVFFQDRLVDEEKVSVSSRGQSSLKKFPRKNLSVKVSKTEDQEKRKVKMGDINSKHFIMSASPEDVLFVKNSIGYSLLKEIGIHSLKTQFAEVMINRQSQGLYMVTDTQANSLLKDAEADVVFRRRYNDRLELKGTKKDLSKEEAAQFQQKLEELHNSIGDLDGDELVKKLEKNLNLENYLKWIAFNYIVKNGDYSDEVYFYGKKNQAGEIYFDISPWDMDDSFSDQMHLETFLFFPNYRMRSQSEKQLIYNYESRIDQKVASDPLLLKRYFLAMEKVVTTLSQENVLENIQAKILNDLNPYLDDADVLKNGMLDSVKTAHSREALKENLQEKMKQIKERMEVVRKTLDDIKAKGGDVSGRVLKMDEDQRARKAMMMNVLETFTSKE